MSMEHRDRDRRGDRNQHPRHAAEGITRPEGSPVKHELGRNPAALAEHIAIRRTVDTHLALDVEARRPVEIAHGRASGKARAEERLFPLLDDEKRLEPLSLEPPNHIVERARLNRIP